MSTQKEDDNATRIKWLRANLSEQAFRDWLLSQRSVLSETWLEEFERQILEETVKK